MSRDTGQSAAPEHPAGEEPEAVESIAGVRDRIEELRARRAMVRAAQAGDRDAFAALYRDTFPSVSRYVSAMLHRRAEAEDAVSQTYLMAWRDLRKLRDAGRFDAWLFRIAHHRALAEAARPRPAPLDAAPEPAERSVFASPTALLDLQRDVVQVRAALARLSEEHRLVLQLRFFAELSHRAIADRMGKSPEAVRQLQARALQKLRLFVDDADVSQVA